MWSLGRVLDRPLQVSVSLRNGSGGLSGLILMLLRSATLLNVFLTNMGASLTDTELTLPGSEALVEGVVCEGEEAVLRVIRWNDAFGDGPPDEIRTEDLDETRFLGDGQAIVIAFAPADAEIPRPESLDQLAAVLGQSRDEGIDGRNTTAIPGPQDFGTGG